MMKRLTIVKNSFHAIIVPFNYFSNYEQETEDLDEQRFNTFNIIYNYFNWGRVFHWCTFFIRGNASNFTTNTFSCSVLIDNDSIVWFKVF